MKIQLPHRVSQPLLYLTCILACVCSFLHALTAAWPLFIFFLFSDTVLFVPVKPYSDGLLNRFVLQNLPQVSEKVNKSTYILYPSAHAGVRGAEPACGCVQ